MSRVIVPMENHINGLHKGHDAVLDFAKTFPGTLVVKVLGNAVMWRSHLLTGRSYVPEKIYSKMVEDVAKKDGIVEEVAVMNVQEAWRAPMYEKAAALVSLYKDFLLLDEYIDRATAMVMGIFAFQYSTTAKDDIIVRGPDVTSFFCKSICKLMSGPKTEVFTNVIKSAETKIREQGSLDKLHPVYRPHACRLRTVIDAARSKYKVGKNIDLVKELNYSYAMKPWKVKDIAVFEGGLVPGRMEITQFMFPLDTGTLTIEEVDYDA